MEVRLADIYNMRHQILIAAILVVNIIVFFTEFKIMNVFFIFYLAIMCGKNAVDIVSDYHFSQTLSRDTVNLDVTLKKKPNIYMFLLESYHDLSFMENVYGIDVSEFRSNLQNRGFTIYNDVYSNHTGTLLTISSLFGMRAFPFQGRANSDVNSPLRELIGGGVGNVLFSTLKKNGYYTSIVTQNKPYYMYSKGASLDDSDIDTSLFGTANLEALRDWIPGLVKIGVTEKKYAVKRGEVIKGNGISVRRSDADLEDFLWPMLAKARQHEPFFIYLKSGAAHTPSKNFTWKQANDWVSGNLYQRLVSESIKPIEDVTSRIIEMDPDAVVILMGDHGAWRFSGIMRGNESEDINDVIRKRGSTPEEVARDGSHIFLAIRTGKTPVDISYGYPMSPANLFRHVFSYLQDNTELLKQRVPSVTYLDKDTIMVRDGIPLQNWEPVERGLPQDR